MTFSKLKQEIKKLNKIIKLPDGDYSEKDNKFIKSTIREFREYMKYLTQENRDEFENAVKDYKNNLQKLINCINDFIPIIQPRYNKAQFREIRKKKRTGWSRTR